MDLARIHTYFYRALLVNSALLTNHRPHSLTLVGQRHYSSLLSIKVSIHRRRL